MIRVRFRNGIHPDDPVIGTLDLEVRHFRNRNRNGRGVTGYGGYTALFDAANGRIWVATCREDEAFSRRKGILTALQRYIHSDSRPGYLKADESFIHDVVYNNDEMEVVIGNLFEDNDPNWWLSGSKGKPTVAAF